MNLKEFVAVLLALFLAFSFGFTLDHFTTWTGPKELFGNIAASSFEVHTLQDVSWTTTDDFDTGTHSDTEARFICGAVTLFTPSDSFCWDDADADTDKWNASSKGSPTVNQMEIANGVLSVDISGGSGQPFHGPIVSIPLTGDFDVRVKIDEGANAAGTRYLYFQIFNVLTAVECPDDGAQDGLLYFIALGTAGAPMSAYVCVNGGFTQIGTNTNRPSDPVWLRMTRVGTAFTWYYSTDGSAWTQDETTTNANIAGNFRPELLCSNVAGGGNRCDLDFDDYHVDGRVQTTGFWQTGDVIIPTARRLGQLSLTFSSLTTANAIDRILFLNNSVPIEIYETDITSGTAFDYFPSEVIGDNAIVSVRFVLKGNGSASPVIESVEFFYSAIGTGVGVIDLTFLWVLVVLFLVVLAIGLWRSPLFLILSGFLGVILTLAIDVELMDGRDDLTRYGVSLILIAMSVVLFAQGALNLRKEFEREAA